MSPPLLAELIAAVGSERLTRILSALPGAAPDGKYRHWSTLRHLPPPGDWSIEEWWLAIKIARGASAQTLPLRDTRGRSFRMSPVTVVQQMLMQVDRDASGQIQVSEQVTDPETRDTYLLKGLMEEAITSSQLEGASTTRDVAKEMILQGRAPQTVDERMIRNNYEALRFIRRVAKQPLTPSTVFELQRILTDGTLADPGAAGRFRTADEEICVMDEIGNVLHRPPPAEELAARMREMCVFANQRGDGESFIHPVVRAIVLHFWLAYDHPFVDGNGRTARALFYWAMAGQGYWLSEYISISRILKKAPGRYSRAFLYAETDDNDLTYFILFQLEVMLRAVRELMQYLETRQRELRQTQAMLAGSQVLRQQLNFRQLAIVRHALKHPRFHYTIASHRTSNNISYGTARSDLLKLVELGLLEQKQGPKRLGLFVSPADLQQRITSRAIPEQPSTA